MAFAIPPQKPPDYALNFQLLLPHECHLASKIQHSWRHLFLLAGSNQLRRLPKPACRTLSVSFPVAATTAQTPQPSEWAAFAHFPTPKGRCFVPTKTHPANTSAIDGLVQLRVYLLAPRATGSQPFSDLSGARSAAIHPSRLN